MSARWRKVLLMVAAGMLALGMGGVSGAAPLERQDVPEPLRPWIEWALRGDPAEKPVRCPAAFDSFDKRRCVWPGTLELRLGREGGTFAQDWELFDTAWVPLPFAEGVWPEEVKLDGHPALFVMQAGAPAVRLGTGHHRLEGRLVWKSVPEALLIRSGALVNVTLDGARREALPDKDGRLYLLGRKTPETVAENQLRLRVFRKLDDDIPTLLLTRLELEVGGAARELAADKVLPPGFVLAAVSGSLPVRMENGTSMHIQARPGRWVVELTARREGAPLDALSGWFPESSFWPEEEIWSFEARPLLRQASPEGVPSIDPRQQGVPSSWRNLPAFIMRKDARLVLAEKRRGDPVPAPDQLNLRRELWIDFDGGGLTARDLISGVMNRTWRLDMVEPAQLGRAVVDGVDQVVTSRDGRFGVEMRQGKVTMQADSRLEGSLAHLSASGWEQDFVSARATLNLPPGWRLLGATGVDSEDGSWLTQWTLQDMFIVLLVALAAGKLWGFSWGLAALAALALSWHEPDAPRWIWLHLLAAVALVRVLPASGLRTLAGLYRNAALVALLVLLLPFGQAQLRFALYPQLEPDHQISYHTPESVSLASEGAVRNRMVMKTARRPMAAAARDSAAAPEDGAYAVEEAERTPSEPVKTVSASAKVSADMRLVDPDAVAQTGPGLPQWRWRSCTLNWNGPLKAHQQIGLFLVPPAVNSALAVVRVLLLGLLAWLMLDTKKWRCFRPRTGWLPIIPLMFAFTLLGTPAARADIPDTELLEELKSRLQTPPDCFPHCAEIHAMKMSCTSNRLVLELDLHAAAEVFAPLPGSDAWLPEQVRLDGRPAPVLRDEHLWVVLAPGRHQVVLEGALPAHETLTLSLPLPPRQIAFNGKGWALEGLNPERFPGEQVQLRRLDAPAATKNGGEKTEVMISPFFQVERTITLGLRWTVKTVVTKRFAGVGPALLKVPLLPGETVVSAGLAVEDGMVTVDFPAAGKSRSWESTLEVAPQLELAAAASESFRETWKLEVGPMWHVQAEGLAVVRHQDASGRRLPEWRPLPGERVRLDISRPEGVAGHGLTLERSLMTVEPGARATAVTLELVWRSAKGGEHVLTLPEGVALERFSVNGRNQPVRQEGRQVTLTLTPGLQTMELFWHMPEGIKARLMTPAVDVGEESVNAHIKLKMPSNRWLVLAGGPRLGPAVLFWGWLALLLPMALLLGRLKWTPLSSAHWFVLGLGLSQLDRVGALLIVCWLLALAARQRVRLEGYERLFNLMQVGLAALSAVALAILVVSVGQGLLGDPQMGISGNGSYGSLLNWYQDRAGQQLPQGWVLSVPLWIYRLLMLFWALWLAAMLLKWLRWGWSAFSTGGLWRTPSKKFKIFSRK